MPLISAIDAKAGKPGLGPSLVPAVAAAGFLLLGVGVGTGGTSVVPPARESPGISEKILEDKPGLLVLEVRISGHGLQAAAAHAGVRVSCAGCQAPERPDGPDLPVYRFDVLSGPVPPTVTCVILESETRIVPEGIAPVPREPFPGALEYHRDDGLYGKAATAEARILEPRNLGRAVVRGVEVPLARWSESGKSLDLIRTLRVEMAFPGAFAAPAAIRPMARLRREVKNPVGGAYLFRASAAFAAFASAAPQARGARGMAKASAARDSLGDRFVRIRVGDNSVEGFEEDRVYGLSFSDLARISGLAGAFGAVRIRNLRMFTGINDTLPTRMEPGIVSAGTLREIPIEVGDNNSNGTFDEGDSIRFFGHGTSIWKRLPESASRIRYGFSADPYSFDNFYYLDFGSRDGLEGGSRLPESGPAVPTLPAAEESYAYLRAEKELATGACNISDPPHKEEETGFEWHWFWKGGCGSDTTVTLTASNLQSSETAVLPDPARDGADDSLFLGFDTFGSGGNGRFTPFYGGNGETMEPYPDTVSRGTWFVWTRPLASPAALQLDKLVWGGSDKRFEGYSVCYRRKHVLSGDCAWIFPPETGKRAAYRIRNAEGARCLRIEAGVATRAFILDGQGAFEDSLPPGSDAKYLVYRKVSALPPANLIADGLPARGGALRDLGTGDGKRPEYLIITSRELLPQALALRDYRNDSKRAMRMNTEVATVEDIYRQYSSGRMSPAAIRDFLRHAYHGWGDPARTGTLTHVLLFGDGHYDYRNIRARAMTRAPVNVIPPYEFFLYADGGEQAASDDFYAMLEAGTFSPGSAMLDVALGRVPVQTSAEAEGYLKKVAAFEDPAQAGEWRSRVVMAADDNIQRGAANNLDRIWDGHTTDSDDLGDVIAGNERGTTVDKVYLLDYPLNAAFHKPEAAQDLLAFINRGSLLVNYIGHGASNQWADEMLMQTNDAISRMRNEGRTPMINSFSCTVGRFESLTSEGMSEQFVKQKGVGAIAAVSATRESFSGPNVELAKTYYRRLFPPDSSGTPVTAGEALREAKNSSETTSGRNDLKYQLLGEPVLLLRKPQLGVALTRVMDTIKALDCDEIKGRITGGSGSGKVNIKIVAGSAHKSYVLVKPQVSQEVEKRGNLLFERTFAYANGAFSTDYFIPKQIAFGDTNAQVLVFAWDDAMEMEGTTARQDLRILGTAQSACATDSDGKGPRIRITGCEKKATGELDFPDHVKLPLPYCLQINVEDSVGGVLSAQGPDEGTSVEFPGVLDPFHPHPGLDELNRKSYQFTLEKGVFPAGAHLLKVSARDGYGNISQRQMRMDLSADSSLQTLMARNVPNPVKRSGTTFYFSAIRPNPDIEFGDPAAGTDTLEFELRIFNQAGNLVRTFPKAQSGRTTWDGRDHWGSLLGNGVYFYSVAARQILPTGGAKPDYRTVSSRRNTLILSR